MAAGDGPAALELSVELRAEQDGHVGDPHPDQEDNDAGQGAVDLVVVTEVGHVQGEQRGSDQPEHDGDEAAGADPLEAVPGVRAGPEQDGEDQPDDNQHTSQLRYLTDADSGLPDAQYVPDLLG